MPRQRYERELAAAMAESFGAVVTVASRGRWAGSVPFDLLPPRSGCQYAQQRGKVLRRGKVLECLRPVSLTLQETLLDPPCCVRLRLHYRLEPVERGSNLRLEARYALNGAATLRRGHWHDRIRDHCGRMLHAIERHVAELAEET
jgi:hypothetical protein